MRMRMTRWLITFALLVPIASCEQDCANPRRDGCCKVCTTGKPCGDTCISEKDTCHTVGGCACAAR